VAEKNHHHGGALVTAAGRERGRLLVVLGIYVVMIAAMVVGAWATGSLALVAEAGHVAVDGSGVAIALVASRLATRAPSNTRTFGWMRAEIVAALLNCVLLLALGVYIAYGALQRLADPPEVAGGWVIAFAVVGLIGNGVSLLLLVRGSRTSLNVRAVFLEVASDAIGSVAIIVSGVVILTTGFQRADAIAALVIGVVIVPRVFVLLRQSVNIIMQGVPAGIDVDAIRTHIVAMNGVQDVHSLHVWAVTSGVPVISAHVVVDDDVIASGSGAEMLDRLVECLRGHFEIEHCTFQIEPHQHRSHEGSYHQI